MCCKIAVYDAISFTGCPYKPVMGNPALFASKTVPGAIYSCPNGMQFDFLSIPCGCFPPTVPAATGTGTGTGVTPVNAADQALIGMFVEILRSDTSQYAVVCFSMFQNIISIVLGPGG